MAVTKTDKNSGTQHAHGLTATDKQIAAIPAADLTKNVTLLDQVNALINANNNTLAELYATKAALATEATTRKTADDALIGRVAALEARVDKLDGAVPPPKPPDVPGPLPVGTTPPKAVRDVAAAGGDATASVMTWLNSLPAKTLVDWDSLTLRLKQIMLESKTLYFTGAGKLIFTAFMTGPAAGSIHMRSQCKDMRFNHLDANGKPQLTVVGAAPASDYGRAHTSQEGTENNHAFWMQGVQGIEIAGVIGYGFGGDSFYSGGWTEKANQWTRDVNVHDNVFSAMGRMFGAFADGGTNVVVRHNQFGVIIPGTPIDSLAKAGPGWNGVIIEPNDAAVADGSAYGYANFLVEANQFGRAYHPGGVSGGMTNATAVKGNTRSKLTPPFIWRDNTSDPKYPWLFVNSYGNAQSINNK